MTKSNIIKGALGILGAVIIGAIGSGVWQGILAPLLSFCRDFVLTIATLGISKFKDSAYIEIAKALSEHTNLSVLSLVYLGIAFFVVYQSMDLVHKMFSIKKKYKKLCEKLENPQKYHENSEMIVQEFVSEKTKDSMSQLIKTTYAGLFFSAIIAFFVSSASVKTSYVQSATTYTNQLITICKPSMTEAEINLIRSNLAQIQNKDNFIEEIDKLKNIAIKNNKVIPKFNPW